jgi:hypothetical protein
MNRILRQLPSPPTLILVCLILMLGTVHAVLPATTKTAATTQATSTRPFFGKDLIVMNELVALYEPVAFDHRTHAQMAETWDGCLTCHHRSPKAATPATTRAALAAVAQRPTQDYADVIPACKSCHPANANAAGINMPSLKGAYHRQCLNCHRDWMDANACVICHAARKSTIAAAPAAATAPVALRDDIVGRMHKPIPEPKDKTYRARFTPADGPNVLFRHDEHVKTFGIKCSGCHRRDSCADCHATTTTAASEISPAANPLQPGRTWRDTHGPCESCHQDDRCNHCHYPDKKAAPAAFEHPAVTGQTLDADHMKLACGQCHTKLKTKAASIGCGDASCHKRAGVALPVDRPGPFNPATTRPGNTVAVVPTTHPATAPATRPTIIRIRRGGS